MIKIGDAWVKPECVAAIHAYNLKSVVTLTTLARDENVRDAAYAVNDFWIVDEPPDVIAARVNAAMGIPDGGVAPVAVEASE